MPQLDIDALKNKADGHWLSIMHHLGIEVSDNPKKHTACPICGPGNNSHRFRFDNKDNKGTWICTQCGSGDAWSLIQLVEGCNFLEAAYRVADVIGGSKMDNIKQQPEIDPSIGLRALYKTLQPLSVSDPVSKYLRSRGLVFEINKVMYSPKCYDSETNKDMQAMVAIVQDRDGNPVTMHRTYLNGDKKADIKSPKKLMPAKVDSLSMCSAAVRLFKIDDVVGIAEGIETAIACRQLFDIPTWAAISSSIMLGFEPPEGIRKVVVFGDNDANFCGQKTAYALANKLYLKDYIVEVQIPDAIGDYNDVLLKGY